jgi:H+/Cl- antiporter ClcA
MIYLLPIIGFFIGFIYHYYGDEANKGNNQIIDAHHRQGIDVPLKMAPLVYIGTILTHLGGGSAGREGTAVQMGGAIAAPFAKWFKLHQEERKTIIIMGVSAGFAAVFGTPLAGAIFALEIMGFKYIRWQSVIPSIFAAYIAHLVCLQWDIQHSIYIVNIIPEISFKNIIWSLGAGFIFGLTALLYSLSNQFFENLFAKINYKPLIPFIGGIIVAAIVVLFDAKKFIGLGIPEMMNAFNTPAGHYDFIIKLLLTSLTLSVGFKGGEVTPLFFIGATLGSAMYFFIPLPLAILAAMGLVAVFAGATHCIIASIVLGIELFGAKAGIYIGITSIVAYFCSGTKSIYSAKIKLGAKFSLYNYFKNISKL